MRAGGSGVPNFGNLPGTLRSPGALHGTPGLNLGLSPNPNLSSVTPQTLTPRFPTNVSQIPNPDHGFGIPLSAGSGIPAQGGPSALDSTYYQQLANATLQANNRINQYNQQSGYAGVDLQNALSQLNYQQGLQTQNTENAENSRGGFALGHLGQSIGQLNHAYLDRQSQDQLSFQRGQAARDAAVAAVRQGLSLEQVALAAAAADRASSAAAKNPALGQSAAPLSPGAPGGQPGTEGAPLPPHPGAPVSQGGARQPTTHHAFPSREPTRNGSRLAKRLTRGPRPTGGVGMPSGGGYGTVSGGG